MRVVRRILNQTLVVVSICILAACATNSAKTTDGVDPNYDAGGKVKAIRVTQTARGVQITSDEQVLFETGRSDIKSDGMIYIQRVATILKTKTKADVMVEGHTDNVGGAVLNQQLSIRRANSVKDALLKQGVVPTRIQAKGFGLTKPVADNSTPAGRQANRRTEIIILDETEANISGPAGSDGLADQLSAGLDKFLKNAGDFMKNAFGDSKSEALAK